MSSNIVASELEFVPRLSESKTFSFEDDLDDLISEEFDVLEVLDDLEHLDEGEYDS